MTIKTGTYPDMTNEEYHSAPGVSKSSLDKVHRSIAHYLAPRTEPTKAMMLGTAVHCAVLEPERYAIEYATMPEGLDGRTKEGKAWKEEYGSKLVLSTEDGAAVAGMLKAIQDHPTANELILNATHRELSCFTECGLTDLLLKCRPDAISVDEFGERVVVDLKTCEDASPKAFEASVAKYRYHVQAAFYSDILTDLSMHPDRFLFVAVEKTAPYNVAVYELDNDSIRQGRMAYERDLYKLDAYLKTPEDQRWAGYPWEVRTIELPNWAREEMV